MKKHFFWAYRRFGTAPRYEFWLRREDDADCCMAAFWPSRQTYRIFDCSTEPYARDFPEQVRTSEDMKKYVETLLRLKGVI